VVEEADAHAASGASAIVRHSLEDRPSSTSDGRQVSSGAARQKGGRRATVLFDVDSNFGIEARLAPVHLS
jgi:hypothetical protein